MAAVRGVDEFAVGVELDLGATVVAVEVGRDGGEGLQFGQGSVGGVVGVGAERAVQFVDVVNELAVGVKREMSRLPIRPAPSN